MSNTHAVAPVLHDYQQVAADFIVDNPYCGLFLDIGFGKTLSTLSALSRINDLGHVLVVAPPAITRSVWLDEIAKWDFAIRTTSLVTGPRGGQLPRAKRLEKLAQVPHDPPTMYFLSMDMLADVVRSLPTTRLNGRQAVLWPFPTVILDESQRVKSHSSQRFKALAEVRPAISRLIELTGTPTPNGLMDLWGQIYLLDQGQALGRNITSYRDTFFRVAKIVNGQPVRWDPLPGAREEIYRRISHLVISVENTTLKLPPVTVNDIHVHLGNADLNAYEKFKTDSVLELVEEVLDADGDVVSHIISPPNEAVLMGKLVQFASGTIYVDDEHNYSVIHSEKIENLDYVLRNTRDNVLVAYRYISEKKEIIDKMTSRGHRVTVFDGSRQMVTDWNAGKIKVMLIHPASAGPGLNLQHGGATLVWYTLPDSAEHYNQANGRLARQGQTRPVMIHRLITAGTRDARTPALLAAKSAEERRLIRSVERDIAAALGTAATT